MLNNLAGASGMGNGATQAPPEGPSNALVPQAQTNAAPATMPTASSSPAAAKQKQVQLSEAKEALIKQATIDRALRGLLSTNEPIPRKQVIDMAVGLVADRVMTAQGMAGYLADLPDDPMQIRQWAAMHAKTVENGLDQLITMLHGVAPEQETAPIGVPPGEPMQ